LLYRVYIDEAGDRGHAPRSSDHFVVSGAVVRDEDDAALRAELEQAKSQLGLSPGNVVHFRKLPHSKKVKICRDISGFSLACISSVLICKKEPQPFPGAGIPYISNPDPLYLWAARLLLERISWFIRDNGGGDSIVTFAHLTRFKAEKLHSYRAALESSDTKIHWPSFAGHPFRINHPDKVHLLQIADCSASAFYKAVERDQYGITETRYLEELRPKLYRYGTRPVTSYGLKVFPSRMANPGQPLEFLRQY
jgi:hypothetical protein